MSTKPLIVAATHGEIAASTTLLDRFHIPYIITGVGMVATAHALTKALHTHSPSYVLNLGIAGSLSRELQIGSVVEVVHDMIFELGAESGDDFIPIQELGFGHSIWHNTPPDGIHLDLNKKHGITVNKVHGNAHSIQMVRHHLPDVSIESMEGAAVFYVCAQEKIPCLQVRAISNYVEVRDRSTWDIPLALKNLDDWLTDFMYKQFDGKS